MADHARRSPRLRQSPAVPARGGRPPGPPTKASAHQITITPTGQHVEVFLGGEKLASSDRAVVLAETGLPDRYYLPAEDVRTDLLRPTSTKSTCPYKGEASYWSAEAGGQVHEDIVWSYPDPIPAAAGITGLLCFWAERGAEVVVSSPQPAS